MAQSEMSLPSEKPSEVSVADSTQSGVSESDPYEAPRKSDRSAYTFGAHRKTRQSFGAYTSLFARKLLPPLGFYREADKYAQLKIKFKDDPFKLDAVDEMWDDYKNYQVRKRFRWPPQLICKKFFWTTGYYADYQKKHRATKLRKPGEDSSEDEFMDPAGQYMIAGGEDDINVEEFERYRAAKKQAQPDAKQRQQTRFAEGGEKDEEGKHDHGHGHGHASDVEEVETVVEYTLIRDPHHHHNKHRHSSVASTGSKKGKDGKGKDGFDLIQDLEAGANKKLVTRRKSVSTVDPTTGEKVHDVQESTEVKEKEKSKGKGKKK